MIVPIAAASVAAGVASRAALTSATQSARVATSLARRVQGNAFPVTQGVVVKVSDATKPAIPTKPTTKRRRKRDDVPTPAAATPEPANDNPPLDYAPPTENIVVDNTPPPVLDYAEPDHDEPYDRCPLCTAAIAGVVGGVVIAVLMAAAFAIKEVMRWLM